MQLNVGNKHSQRWKTNCKRESEATTRDTRGEKCNRGQEKMREKKKKRKREKGIRERVERLSFHQLATCRDMTKEYCGGKYNNGDTLRQVNKLTLGHMRSAGEVVEAAMGRERRWKNRERNER